VPPTAVAVVARVAASVAGVAARSSRDAAARRSRSAVVRRTGRRSTARRSTAARRSRTALRSFAALRRATAGRSRAARRSTALGSFAALRRTGRSTASRSRTGRRSTARGRSRSAALRSFAATSSRSTAGRSRTGRRRTALRSTARSRGTAGGRSRAAVRRAGRGSTASSRSRSTALGSFAATAAAARFLTGTLPLIAMNRRATGLHNDGFAAAGLAGARAPTALATTIIVVPGMEQVEHIGLRDSGQPERGDHGATQSHPFHDAESPSLGIRIRGPSPSVGDVPAKCFFVGYSWPDLVRKSRPPGDARRVSPSYRPQSRRLRRQNVFHHAGSAFLGPLLGSGSRPEPRFQAVHELRPSRSVSEGLDQSIGGIRTTALVAQTSNSQGAYVKRRAGFFAHSACEKWMRP
jgi:hypothetical protein